MNESINISVDMLLIAFALLAVTGPIGLGIGLFIGYKLGYTSREIDEMKKGVFATDEKTGDSR